MPVTRVLNDNILIKVLKEIDQEEMRTSGGLWMIGIEQDVYMGQVVMCNSHYYDDDGKRVNIQCRPGDTVVFEKNFHHVYDIQKRNRIDHTMLVDDSKNDYNYYITKYQDIYLTETDEEEGSIQVNSARDIFGTLYSIMHKKSVNRVG